MTQYRRARWRYYDIAAYVSRNMKKILRLDVECEHVSYRLNNEEYNIEYFTEIGTPSEILAKILNGTGFTVGTVQFTNNVTYSAQEAKSRRGLLMEFAVYIGAEIDFNGFSISLLTQRGDSTPKDLRLIEI